MCVRLNGGPYQVNDRVLILTGKHKGTVTCVYEITKSQGNWNLLRLDLGPEVKNKYGDIFEQETVTRVQDPATPDATTNYFQLFPLAPMMDALRSVVGRAVCVLIASEVGAFIGGVIASRSVQEGSGAVVALPFFAFGALFTLPGIFIFPTLFIFAFVFVRSEWPLWLASIFTVLVAVMVYATSAKFLMGHSGLH